MAKKTIEDEINGFLEIWDFEQLCSFLEDVIHLVHLYDVDEKTDWVREAVGELNETNVRLIRTVYLISRLAERHAGKLCSASVRYKNLWRKLEKIDGDAANPN